jgi:hypothetical protein
MVYGVWWMVYGVWWMMEWFDVEYDGEDGEDDEENIPTR